MITFGVDVLVLGVIGVVCIGLSTLMSLIMPLDEQAGNACVLATFLTCTCMTFGYMFVTRLFEIILSL